MSIPKTIHYCWFGRNPKPKLAEKCIRSWKKYCPDYEIIEWNEDNYDVTKHPFMAAAYQEKKWGFVPDYARLDIIYTYGGIYLDTDVEIIKPLDDLLSNEAFAGIEQSEINAGKAYIALGLGFGAEKHNPAIKAFLDSYDKLSFYKEDGSLNLIPSPTVNLACAMEMGFSGRNTMQQLEHLTVYPTEYFCPLGFYSRSLKRTENTYSIHWFAASWLTKEDKKNVRKRRHKLRRDRLLFKPKRLVLKLLGQDKYDKLKKMIKRT